LRYFASFSMKSFAGTSWGVIKYVCFLLVFCLCKS
jgi:hypothetical protein